MRTIIAIVVAVVLGLLASTVWFSGDDAPQPAPATDAPPAEDMAMIGMPPPETLDPVFESCAHCHQVGDGARHTSGPQLNGIPGRSAAATDYPYSAAMRHSGLVWDEDTLVRFLVDPDSVVTDTRMLFEGMPREDAERIVAYLRSIDPHAD